MTNQLSRIDTTKLYPPFLDRIQQLLDACAARGAIYVATSGLRTYAEQAALYARGRTAPGPKVTNARPGYSPHNFGIAIDFCRHRGQTFQGKLDPDYSEKGMKVLGEEAARLGLDWGGAWVTMKDTPHIQLPIKTYGLTWARFRAWHDNGGIDNVFDNLDQLSLW